jgi:hypothetical protein
VLARRAFPCGVIHFANINDRRFVLCTFNNRARVQHGYAGVADMSRARAGSGATHQARENEKTNIQRVEKKTNIQRVSFILMISPDFIFCKNN